MKCVYCGSSQSRTIDTRTAREDQVVKRRRECLSCLKRFTTYEQVKTGQGQER